MSEVHNKETNEHAVAGAMPSADDMPAVKKPAARKRKAAEPVAAQPAISDERSEEHTSELQSH